MKRILAALFIVLAFAANVYAKDATFQACTADNHKAELTLLIEDQTSEKVEKHIRQVFKAAAGELSYADLVTNAGFHRFFDALSDEDKAAIESFTGAPSDLGNCK